MASISSILYGGGRHLRRSDSGYSVHPDILTPSAPSHILDLEANSSVTLPVPQKFSLIDEDEPWRVVIDREDYGKPWKAMTSLEKIQRIMINTSKIVLAFCFLYLFICSLDFLASAFELLAGTTTDFVLKNKYIQNPIVGFMIGILATVLIQSSSTAISIIVSMVSAKILDVASAIPIVYGSNLGTSVTNTIVSVTQVRQKDIHRRAFAGATLHDTFNLLTAGVLMTLEMATGMMEKIVTSITSNQNWSAEYRNIKLLSAITEPFTNRIIQLDECILQSEDNADEGPTFLFRRSCKNEEGNPSKALSAKECDNEDTSETNCQFLFHDSTLTDTQIGIILLVAALLLLFVSMLAIVKILSSVMKGKIGIIIKNTINSNVPHIPWITGYITLCVGALVTVITQSSSIFTATLNPLIGIGVISIERAYPLTIGSNIGTTTTALLASMAAGKEESLIKGIQIALVHLLFNIFGFLLFYPVPFMRLPIRLAKMLGNITTKHRWFAFVYLFVMFFLFPGLVFTLTLGGTIVMAAVGIPLLIVLAFIILKCIDIQNPWLLPPILRCNWLTKKLRIFCS